MYPILNILYRSEKFVKDEIKSGFKAMFRKYA